MRYVIIEWLSVMQLFNYHARESLDIKLIKYLKVYRTAKEVSWEFQKYICGTNNIIVKQKTWLIVLCNYWIAMESVM